MSKKKEREARVIEKSGKRVMDTRITSKHQSRSSRTLKYERDKILFTSLSYRSQLTTWLKLNSTLYIKVDKLDTPTYSPKFSPPQSQDAFGIETGMYDHRSRGCMDREDFGILTTTMDGIITAMNVMSDQMNNHSTLVVNELKDQREKKS